MKNLIINYFYNLFVYIYVYNGFSKFKTYSCFYLFVNYYTYVIDTINTIVQNYFSLFVFS